MGLFDTQTIFHEGGKQYQHSDPQPSFEPHAVRRFVYGQEPHVIALVPLADGGNVEVHGYATHWSKDWVSVVWTDEHSWHMNCWVPAMDVRRPSDDSEWHGRFVQFG